MGYYDSQISRSNADDLIPPEVAAQVIAEIPQASAVLPLATRLPNMSREQRNIPVVDVLPTAYFLNPGSTGTDAKKKTTNMEWTGVSIYAEELAVIVPIAQSTLDDSNYPIWEQVRPALQAAFAKAIDAAILYGTNRPSTWPVGVHPAAVAASQTLVTAAVSGEDLYDEIMGDGNLIALIEADGYIPTAHLCAVSMRGKLRGTRDSIGHPIFTPILGSAGRYDLGDGVPTLFPTNGAFDAATTLMITGDWSKIVYAFRQELTFTLSDSAILTDEAGMITHNAFQEDKVFLRAVMRLGWAMPKPPTALQPTAASRCPFACLLP